MQLTSKNTSQSDEIEYLGGELLPWCLSTGGLTGGLLGTSHRRREKREKRRLVFRLRKRIMSEIRKLERRFMYLYKNV